MGDIKKTGITEAGIAAIVVSALEAAQRFLGDSPMIPDPWGPIVLGGIGFAVVVARVFAKQSAAK